MLCTLISTISLPTDKTAQRRLVILSSKADGSERVNFILDTAKAKISTRESASLHCQSSFNMVLNYIKTLRKSNISQQHCVFPTIVKALHQSVMKFSIG